MSFPAPDTLTLHSLLLNLYPEKFNFTGAEAVLGVGAEAGADAGAGKSPAQGYLRIHCTVGNQ